LLLALAAPAAAQGERAVGDHRWLAPVPLSVPTTSALALVGIAGLAAHLFRRRRDDAKQRPPNPQGEEDWQRRIAMWERRLRSGSNGDEARDTAATDDKDPPPA
jgi:hypothetical protein